VNIPAASGDMDILAAHMPSVEELKPDLVATRHRSVRPPSDDFLNKYINRDWLPSTTLSALTSLRKDSLRTDSPTVKRLLPIPAPSSPAFQAFTKPHLSLYRKLLPALLPDSTTAFALIKPASSLVSMGFITDPRKFDSVIANIFSSPVSSSVSESGPSRRLFQYMRLNVRRH
ncbi:unnamed protein product, partial [Tilletia controversa]